MFNSYDEIVSDAVGGEGEVEKNPGGGGGGGGSEEAFFVALKISTRFLFKHCFFGVFAFHPFVILGEQFVSRMNCATARLIIITLYFRMYFTCVYNYHFLSFRNGKRSPKKPLDRAKLSLISSGLIVCI